ncbi:RAD51-like 1 (S. cerevisiae), isoform CRA_c, partial [Mus musculus]
FSSHHPHRSLQLQKESNFLFWALQILIAKSPLAAFTSFVYTIKGEGLVLQGHERP